MWFISTRLEILLSCLRPYGAPPVNLNIKTPGSRPYGQGIVVFFPSEVKQLLATFPKELINVSWLVLVSRQAEGSGSGRSREHQRRAGAGGGAGVLRGEAVEEARWVCVPLGRVLTGGLLLHVAFNALLLARRRRPLRLLQLRLQRGHVEGLLREAEEAAHGPGGLHRGLGHQQDLCEEPRSICFIFLFFVFESYTEPHLFSSC